MIIKYNIYTLLHKYISNIKGGIYEKIVVILSFLLSLSSCSNNLKASEILTYFNKKNNVTENMYYLRNDYGTYSGARVIQINHDYGFYVVVTEKIEDLEFTYSQQSHNIDVFYEGKFYTLTSAYEQGILSYKDLKKIHKKHIKIVKKLGIEEKGVIIEF